MNEDKIQLLQNLPKNLKVILPLLPCPERKGKSVGIDLGEIVDKLNEVIIRLNGGEKIIEESVDEDVEEVEVLEMLHERSIKKPLGCITKAFPTDAWKGKTCFILAGGPSLENFDFKLIKNYPTIGVNKSFIEFPTDILYGMDLRFYNMLVCPQTEEAKHLSNLWNNYKGDTVFLRRVRDYPYDSVYTVNQIDGKFSESAARKRLEKAMALTEKGEVVSVDNIDIGFDLDEGIIGGNNSGFGALQLAIGLGCSDICLLGFDMAVKKVDKKIQTHYHGGYSFEHPRTFQGKLNKFAGCFEEHAESIKEAGIRVVNANPNSELDCFEKVDLRDYLKSMREDSLKSRGDHQELKSGGRARRMRKITNEPINEIVESPVELEFVDKVE